MVKASGALHSNSGDINVAAAVGGLGISMRTDFMVGAVLADGRLVRAAAGVPRPARRHLGRLPEPASPVAKVRLFVDHVARHFAAAPRRLR